MLKVQYSPTWNGWSIHRHTHEAQKPIWIRSDHIISLSTEMLEWRWIGFTRTQSVEGCWSLPDSILGCVFTYSPSRSWWGLNVMGFMCPWFPYKGKLPGMLKISQTFMVMPLQMSRSQGLGQFGLLGVSIQHSWSICHSSRAQSNWNPQDPPPNNIFAAIKVKINDNKWPSQPYVWTDASSMHEISG